MGESLIARQLAAFQQAGEMLFACRCNNSHSGNLSVRVGDRVVITRMGAMLARLLGDDLVEVGFTPTGAERERASSELDVHLGIYARTNCQSIAHGHALAAVAVGWLGDRIQPIDVEGAYYFGPIPIVEHTPATADPGLGDTLGVSLNGVPVVVLRGHGVFAIGETLEQASQRIASVNDSAELIIKARQLGLDLDKLASAPYLNFGR